MRTEFLDEASMYRLDTQMEGIGHPDDKSGMRGSLARAGRAISGATSQIQRLKDLNEESAHLRSTLRAMNTLLVALMEGKIKPGDETFTLFLLVQCHNMQLEKDDEQLVNLYIHCVYGEFSGIPSLPFSFAKRAGLFPEYITKTEKEITEEVEAQKAAFARRVWTEFDKQFDYMMYLWRNFYHHDDDPMSTEERAIESWRLQCGFTIESYNNGEKPFEYETETSWLTQITKETKPLVKREVKEISIWKPENTISPSDVISAIRQDMETRGCSSYLEAIDKFVQFCTLLREPANHIFTKVVEPDTKPNIPRTVADMTNEMARELTVLPKYTAYAKVLCDEGHEVWSGEIRTVPLKTGHAPVICETMQYVRERKAIEAAIRERHEAWRGGGSDEPPPVHS